MNPKRAAFAKMIAEYPWEKTPLGPRDGWPWHLQRSLAFVLDAGAPMALLWGPDFRFLYNEPYAEIIQEKHPFALGAAGIEIFPELWSSILPFLEQTRRGDAVLIEDLELMLKRGGVTRPAFFSFSYNPIKNTDGQVDGILAVVVETTTRVIKEQERAHVFDTVLSAITDFAYTFTAQGKFAYVNKALLDLWGLKLEQAVGKDFFELNYPIDLAERLQRQIRQVFEEKTSVRDETRYVSPTGVEGFYEYIFSPVFDASGAVSLVAGSTRDITSRKKLEMAALAAAQAKDDFLAALSHELRTPLTPALMMTNALREDTRLPEDVRMQLGTIERNIALEARLIDDLLDLTAISRGKLSLHVQPCDSHSLIGLAIGIVAQDAAAKAITITRTFAAERGGLLADPARIQQVVWNLLRNAVKFTPSGGKVTVQTEDFRANDEDWIRIRVTDTGIGIDPVFIDRIFNPFDQGGMSDSHRFGGLGLGLSIARAVVQLHRGKISAHSEGTGRGASFVVELPGATLPPDGSVETEKTGGEETPATPPAPLHLLLVEDHESTLAALSAMLRREGHSVVARSSVASALAAAAAEKFDLVISDLGLPDGTGNDLMSELNAKYGLRGIALSGYGMEEDIDRSQAAGFILHLIKPVPNLHLRRALASIRNYLK